MRMPHHKTRFIYKKQAALRQLHAAIDHLREGNYECSITLAGAAEGMLAGQKNVDFWKVLKFIASQDYKSEKEAIAELNETRDWLKHPTPQLDNLRGMHIDEAAIACLRAAMQFRSVFHQSSSKIDRFLKFAVKRDLAPDKEWAWTEYPRVSD